MKALMKTGWEMDKDGRRQIARFLNRTGAASYRRIFRTPQADASDRSLYSSPANGSSTHGPTRKTSPGPSPFERTSSS
jgi:hypothetical protein